jgi:hypothetical protein
MRHSDLSLVRGHGESGTSWNDLERWFWFGNGKCLIALTDSVVHEWSRSEQSRYVGMVPCNRA